MTKYKLNNDLRSHSEVTLTSYLTGSESHDKLSSDPDRNRIQHEPFTISGNLPRQDTNFNTEVNINFDPGNRTCHFCPHSCQSLTQIDKFSHAFTKNDKKKIALEKNGIGLEKNGVVVALEKNGVVVEKNGIGHGNGVVVVEKNGLNLEKGGNYDNNICLCEKYNGGCSGRLSHSCSGIPCHPVYSKGTSPSKWSDHSSSDGHSGGSAREIRARIGRRARSACSIKTLVKRIPIIGWLPDYNLQAGFCDMIAGLTVGLTVIPQAIAYANVAGLPPQYGLYSSFMACFVYTIFGSCKDSPIGPTAIAAILTRENLHGLGPEFAVLLCFLSGCVELLMGILQLGFLIDFISGPVSVGFTSAAAIIIATTQVKDILGLSFPGGKFLQVWTGLYEHIGETRLWDTVLGVSCIVVLLLLRKVKDINVDENGSETASWPRRALAKALWFLCTTRNILVVVVCAALASYFDTKHQQPFVLTGEVKPGLPEISLPPFQSTVGNHTYTFMEMASTLGSAIFVVPLLSILENIALAKVFSDGKYVDATQEMIAIGLCNIASSLVDSMPVSGALSRGAVNHASGVRTTAGGLYTGALVLLSLQYFTPYFYFIPKASLAAVIIAAVVFMMELHVFKPIWRTKKLDIIPAIVTFISCLVIRLELGIVIGIAVNLLFLLYASARPSVRVTRAVSASGVEHLVGAVDRSLSFPSAEYVRRALRKAAERGATDLPPPPLVIDATHVQAADFTAAKGIKSLIDDFHARGQSIIFYNVKPSIVEIFRAVRPREFLHCACPAELDAMLRAATTRTDEGV